MTEPILIDAGSWEREEAERKAREGEFFGMSEACEKAIKAYGVIARCWNHIEERDRSKRCQIGTGGAGYGHMVYGVGSTWLEAARDAGLLGGSPREDWYESRAWTRVDLVKVKAKMEEHDRRYGITRAGAIK